MYTKTISSIGQLVLGVAVLIVSYVEYKKDPPTTGSLFLAILVLFTSSLLIDKLGLVFSNLVAESDERKLRETLRDLPGLFAGQIDVVTFPSDVEGMRYCIAVCPLAVHVKNTVLRYGGNKYEVDEVTGGYTEWLSAKKRSILAGCSWEEIVAVSIGADKWSKDFVDPQRINPRHRYLAKFLDEDKTPMVQMTIFHYGNGTKEIVFGWQIPNLPHGPCFLTRNEKLIEYLDSYFMHFWMNLASDGQRAPAPSLHP